MNKLIAFTWELPQTIAALIVCAVARKKPESVDGLTRVYIPWNRAFTLGQFICAPTMTSKSVIKHEYGHTRQSLILGWLYLPIVGISSAIIYIIYHACGKTPDWYHSKFPENWADKLSEK